MFFFFFNDTATTEIYTLSLHDALPISASRVAGRSDELDLRRQSPADRVDGESDRRRARGNARRADRVRGVRAGRRAGDAADAGVGSRGAGAHDLIGRPSHQKSRATSAATPQSGAPRPVAAAPHR